MNRTLNIGNCLIALFITMMHYGNAQNIKESSLWGPKGANWDPAGRLPDFSYAGYRSSDRTIPNVRQVASLATTGALANDNIDDSEKLQDLINAQTSISVNNPGAIFIPRGKWVIDNPILLNKSGLVLRGEVDAAGKPITEFYFPNASNPLTDYHITMNRGNFNLTSLGTIATNVAQGKNNFQIKYSTANKFNVGDFIQLVQEDDVAESLASYLHGDLDQIGNSTKEISIYPKLFRWYAKVKAVSGDIITLDRPLPIKVQTSWKPTVSRFDVANSATEMGIENIVFKCNNTVRFEHNIYTGWRILTLNQVINCWVKNVELVDLEYGIDISNSSCYNTITDIVIRDEKRNVPLPNVAGLSDGDAVYKLQQLAGGGHHPIQIGKFGCFNLIENFDFKDIYWHELSVEGAVAFNVFRNGKGIAIAFDNHRQIPFANLWTNIDLGRPERLWWNSGSNQIGVAGRERGPNSGFRTTYWNINYKNVSPGARVPVASTDGFAYLNYVGVVDARKGSSPVAKVNSQLVEISGANEKVAQPDLFQAQLDRRKGNITTDIEEVVLEDSETISIFPNPSNDGKFTLSKECVWKVISQKGIDLKSGKGNQINLSEYPKGVYLIKMNEKVERVVVE